ncbi:MAG: tetratricopeptide repeat protein, partial [Saprospirales bacterium]|nr:tetratricopeptide repeat protein [Saprospirales bacterium]
MRHRIWCLNYEIATTYLALKDTAKALAYCEKSIKSTDKLNELAFVLYGTILDGQNKSDAAIEKFTEGLKIYPNSSILHYNLALTYFNNYKDKEAEENAKKAIAINPQYASSHLILAYTMLAQKKRIPCIFCALQLFIIRTK